MSGRIDRLLADAVTAGDIQGLAAAVTNVLAAVSDPSLPVGGSEIREAVELGLSSSTSIRLRTGRPVE